MKVDTRIVRDPVSLVIGDVKYTRERVVTSVSDPRVIVVVDDDGKEVDRIEWDAGFIMSMPGRMLKEKVDVAS